MRNEKWVCKPNKALHLKRIKDQKWAKGAHLEQSYFWRKREEKREKRARAREGASFGWVSSHFLAPL